MGKIVRFERPVQYRGEWMAVGFFPWSPSVRRTAGSSDLALMLKTGKGSGEMSGIGSITTREAQALVQRVRREGIELYIQKSRD